MSKLNNKSWAPTNAAHDAIFRFIGLPVSMYPKAKSSRASTDSELAAFLLEKLDSGADPMHRVVYTTDGSSDYDLVEACACFGLVKSFSALVGKGLRLRPRHITGMTALEEQREIGPFLAKELDEEVERIHQASVLQDSLSSLMEAMPVAQPAGKRSRL